MFEVEQKFRIDNVERLVNRLGGIGAIEGPRQSHRDTYFNHPCRDFRESREALRIRRVNDTPSITYKGPHVAGTIKARQELEWELAPGDPNGEQMESLLSQLGFRPVATVEKSRRSFSLSGKLAAFSVVIDRVERIGDFAELELLVPDADGIESARQQIAEFSRQLGLEHGESRSYLAMYLESLG